MPGLFMISGPGLGLVRREYLLHLHQTVPEGREKKGAKRAKSVGSYPELPLLVAATLRPGTDSS
jgi:hypothetical protein